MKLSLPLHEADYLDDASYSENYAVGVLAMGDIERYYTTLDFVDKKWEIRLVGCDEKRSVLDTKLIESIKVVTTLLIYYPYNKFI